MTHYPMTKQDRIDATAYLLDLAKRPPIKGLQLACWPLSRVSITKENLPLIAALADCFGGMIPIQLGIDAERIEMLETLARPFSLTLKPWNGHIIAPDDPSMPKRWDAYTKNVDWLAKRLDGRVELIIWETEHTPLAYRHSTAVRKWPKVAGTWAEKDWDNAIADNNAAVRGYFQSRFPGIPIECYNRNDRSPLYPLRHTPRKGVPNLNDSFPAYYGGSYRLDHCATDDVSAWFSLGGGWDSGTWNTDLPIPISWFAKQGAELGRSPRIACVTFWPTPLMDDRTPLAVQMLRLRLFVDGAAAGRRKLAA